MIRAASFIAFTLPLRSGRATLPLIILLRHRLARLVAVMLGSNRLLPFRLVWITVPRIFPLVGRQGGRTW